MPIVHECGEEGCTVLTMGELCIDHEDVVPQEYLRGRPLASFVEQRELVEA
jgi:hypothetical protein